MPLAERIVENRIGRAVINHLPSKVRTSLAERAMTSNKDQQRFMSAMGALDLIPEENYPDHIIITPDGNRRKGKELGISKKEAHALGARKAARLLDIFEGVGIKYITFWGMSQLNMEERTEEETDSEGTTKEERENIMGVTKAQIKESLPRLKAGGARFQHIGRRDRIEEYDPELLELIDYATEETKDNNKYVFTLAFDYGGRPTDEVLNIMKAVEEKVQNEGTLGDVSHKDAEKILDENISHNLPRKKVLFFRTGVEDLRVSYTSGFGLLTLEAAVWSIQSMFPDSHEADYAEGLWYVSNANWRKGK